MLCAFHHSLLREGDQIFFTLVFIFVSVDLLLFNSFPLCFFFSWFNWWKLIDKEAGFHILLWRRVGSATCLTLSGLPTLNLTGSVPKICGCPGKQPSNQINTIPKTCSTSASSLHRLKLYGLLFCREKSARSRAWRGTLNICPLSCM